MNQIKLFVSLLFCVSCLCLRAQEPVPLKRDSVSLRPLTDSVPRASKALVNKYDSLSRLHKPSAAAIRSAILPGLGQIYNKKYWKLPIIYGALGTCAAVFVYNLENYKDTRFAYKVKYNMRVNGTDSALYNQIPPRLRPIG